MAFMEILEVAKNLLEGKCCDTCWRNAISPHLDRCFDRKTAAFELCPENKTCEYWGAIGQPRWI